MPHVAAPAVFLPPAADCALAGALSQIEFLTVGFAARGPVVVAVGPNTRDATVKDYSFKIDK